MCISASSGVRMRYGLWGAMLFATYVCPTKPFLSSAGVVSLA